MSLYFSLHILQELNTVQSEHYICAWW